MLKAVLEKPFKLKLLESDIPVAKKRGVLIKVLVAGICGSDLHAHRGTQPFGSYPRVLGHEIAGEIVEVGEGIKDLRRGNLVTWILYSAVENAMHVEWGGAIVAGM